MNLPRNGTRVQFVVNSYRLNAAKTESSPDIARVLAVIENCSVDRVVPHFKGWEWLRLRLNPGGNPLTLAVHEHVFELNNVTTGEF